jgi:hypothetical protein
MKYKGTFNFQGELSELSTGADKEAQALLNLCHGMAKKYGVRKGKMTAYFNGQHDNYTIKEVKNGTG